MAVQFQEIQQQSNIVSQASGDNFVINVDTNDTLVLIVIGWRNLDQFKNRDIESDISLADDTINYWIDTTADLSNQPIVLTLNSNAGTWDHQQGPLVMDGVLTTATPPDTYARSQWNIDGYFPSIYMLHNTADCIAGQATVNVATQYPVDDGGTYASSVSGLRPIFDGGVNLILLRYSGTTGHTNSNHGTISTITNPAVVTSSSTLDAGDLGITIGLMKNGNQMSPGSTDAPNDCQYVAGGKCVGTEAHWMIESVICGDVTTQMGIVNPGNYEMCLDLLGLKQS